MGVRLFDWLGHALTRYLTAQIKGFEPSATNDPARLAAVLKPGDVLLVEGNTRVSSAIKYLTNSTWSHAALYVGDVLDAREPDGEPHVLVEVELGAGCVSIPLSKYAGAHTRICRPVGLPADERARVVRFMVTRIGMRYDLKNVVDLLRYLLPKPPVPQRFRRRMIALGSGDPTRAICSTLIAQAFQEVRYPVLPKVMAVGDPTSPIRNVAAQQEILHIRHHSLYTPRDFDLSPYFAVVKPTIETGFDYTQMVWGEAAA
jgi:hypothetical protein